MNKLNFSFVYKKFKKRLQETYGKEIALLIWKKADAKLKNFSAEYKNIGSDEKIMILPLALILPLFFGVDGIFWAEPIASMSSAITSGILLFFCYKKLK